MKAGVFELSGSDLRTQMLWLRRLAFCLVGRGPHAEDAVQDTLVAALEYRPALDRDVRPWLARVLANFIHRGHRSDRRRRNRETHAGGEHAAAPLAEDLLVRHEAARVVAGLVSALPDPHRQLVLLRFAEGLTAAEIARQHGVPEGTVRRQLKEALDQLRGTVAAHYGSEARDWRLALLPLATNQHEPLPVASTEGIPMTVKKTALLGFTSAALALGLTLALIRGCTQHAEQVGKGTTASPTAGGRTGPAPSTSPPPGSPASTPRAPGAGPPSFASTVPGDPPGCGEKLAEMRARAAKYTPASAAIFERARSSPGTQVKFAPIIERAIGRWVRRAAYQLECRVAICRVGYVVDSGAEPPIWFTALPGEINELFPKMPFQSDKIETTKWAVATGTTREAYIRFSISDVAVTVTSAKIRLYGNAVTGAKTIKLSAVTDTTWVEGTGTVAAPTTSGVTWNTKPAVGAQQTSQSISTTAGWREFDVTSYVQAQKNAGATKVTLAIASLTQSDNGPTAFNSKENASNKPLVVITSK